MSPLMFAAKQAIAVVPLLDDANAVDSIFKKLKPFKEQKNKTALLVMDFENDIVRPLDRPH